MADLSDYSTAELERELAKRQGTPPCPECGKWITFRGVYDTDGYCTRCAGCLRATERCTCV